MCEWPGCTAEGEHRAPQARDRLDQYRWFCLDHVREYNRNWDYYRGMTQTEIEADLRRDTVWQRPTWPLGGGRQRRPNWRIHDGFGFFTDDPEQKAREKGRPAAEAAWLIVGAMWVRIVSGPTHHRIVPSVRRPARRSICSPSAAIITFGTPSDGRAA